MQKILVVEDDRDIQELLQEFLKEAGYMIDVAVDGVEAITMFNTNSYDLILLDIMLPKITGYSVCELIRKQSQIPIIMLTALDSESDQVKGLDLQADDYITKPFSMPILLRKIAAVLRRSNRNSDDNVSIHYKDLILDLDGYKVYIKNGEYDLTQREVEVLRELLYHPGKVLSRQYILNTLWKYADQCAQCYFDAGYQVVYAIHGTNESDLHIHFAVSTINFRSGLKWHDSKTDLDLREALFNKILGKYQYMFIVNK